MDYGPNEQKKLTMLQEYPRHLETTGDLEQLLIDDPHAEPVPYMEDVLEDVPMIHDLPNHRWDLGICQLTGDPQHYIEYTECQTQFGMWHGETYNSQMDLYSKLDTGRKR